MCTSISLSSGNNYTTCVPILQSSTSEGKRNLGVWLAPDDNNKADLEILYSKGRTMSMHIAVSQLKRHEVAIAYKMVLRPAMKYSLSSTTLTTQECAKVDRSYLPTLLSQISVNCCTKQTLLFGSPSLGALGFTNIWTDQGIAKVQFLLEHLRQDADVWKLMQIVMENLQLVIWSALPLFQYPVTQVLQFCSRNWLLNIWDFVLCIGGRLYFERAWLLEEAQRVNDVFLMDQFTSHTPHFTPKTLKRLNACRIFLQVLTLADITDGSGSHILKCSLQGTRHLDRRSSYRWPQQVCPSPAAWNIWHKSLLLLVCCTCTSNKLRNPLGRWHNTGPIHQIWTYFVGVYSQGLLCIPEGKSMYILVLSSSTYFMGVSLQGHSHLFSRSDNSPSHSCPSKWLSHHNYCPSPSLPWIYTQIGLHTTNA